MTRIQGLRVSWKIIIVKTKQFQDEKLSNDDSSSVLGV